METYETLRLSTAVELSTIIFVDRRAGDRRARESRVSGLMACTLLACWGEGHKEAWLILTDLPPAQGDASWYGLRSWIEQFFKDAKRGGWQWQQTRMTEPEGNDWQRKPSD